MEVPTVLNPAGESARRQSNLRLAFSLALVAVLFVGFGFAMVPIYDVICRITGVNGKPNSVAAVVDKNTQVDESRWVNVEFLSHSMPGVPVVLAPEKFTMKVHPGAIVHTFYVARNGGDEAFVGQAVPSITPAVAAPYFQKIECFCFSQQKFQPAEQRSMPLVFVVNPDLSQDIGTVTLSYSFYEAVKAKV